MAALELLTEDAAGLLSIFGFGPTWGIYLNGSPVIQPATSLTNLVNPILSTVSEVAALVGVTGIVPVAASTVDFEFGQDFPISNYPQENGGFQPYDKVTLPFDVKLKLACGGSTSVRQAFIQTCLAIANSFALFDVVTPELTFPSVNCTHIHWPRSAKRNATLIEIDLAFQQIPVVGVQQFTNTKQPGESAPLSLGNLQPQTPSPAIQSQFSTGSLPLG